MSDGRSTRGVRRRQLPVVLLGLLLSVGAALGFGVWARAQAERTPILIASAPIPAGDTVSRDSFDVIEVAVPSPGSVIVSSQVSSIDGLVTQVPIAKGQLVSTAMFGDVERLSGNEALVGAVLEMGSWPSGLRVGDTVSLVHTEAEPGTGLLGEAEVFAFEVLADGVDVKVTFRVGDVGLASLASSAAASNDLSVVKVG